MLWDAGEWDCEGNPQAVHDAGEIKFELYGTKLRGKWLLVRMKGEASEGGKNWLLIKRADREAKAESKYAVVDEQPFSVATLQEDWIRLENLHIFSRVDFTAERDGDGVALLVTVTRGRPWAISVIFNPVLKS